MDNRAPVVLGALLSLSFFAGLVTLLLLSQTAIPPQGVPLVVRPELAGPPVTTTARGGTNISTLVSDLPTAGVSLRGETRLSVDLPSVEARGALDGASVAPFAPDPGPDLGSLGGEGDSRDRHSHTSGKGHQKQKGRGHWHDSGGADVAEKGGTVSRGKAPKPPRSSTGKPARKAKPAGRTNSSKS